MNTYRITNPTSGTDLGTYTATTPAQALDLMAREAGYESYVACHEDVPAPAGGLRVTMVVADGATGIRTSEVVEPVTVSDMTVTGAGSVGIVLD